MCHKLTGGTSAGFNCSGDMDFQQEGTYYQYLGNEGNTFKDRISGEYVVLMSNNTTVVVREAGRDRTFRHVQTGTGHHRMVRAAHSVCLSKVHPKEKRTFWQIT